MRQGFQRRPLVPNVVFLQGRRTWVQEAVEGVKGRWWCRFLCDVTTRFIRRYPCLCLKLPPPRT
ncbi:hypothetical protein E2C01_044281 [Portunus trituberculatus]|uniref:Uncharacterized protein n=1 Tax=Portunus trituberculatus TaxID=210409 RepID=A0A5B7FZK1_PORTR|nr:hypothetical protein [Portunus trituberculatus]